ncbi:twin-arginine translocase TatA/TatE family subunit [Microtetraspora sp. NBRC 16547]
MFLRNGLEPGHLLIIGLALILLFGSKKLPDAAGEPGRTRTDGESSGPR